MGMVKKKEDKFEEIIFKKYLLYMCIHSIIFIILLVVIL